MTLLRMIRHWRAWNAGETAAFAPDIADDLIASGVAELVAPKVSDPALEAPHSTPEPQPRRPGRPRKT